MDAKEELKLIDERLIVMFKYAFMAGQRNNFDFHHWLNQNLEDGRKILKDLTQITAQQFTEELKKEYENR